MIDEQVIAAAVDAYVDVFYAGLDTKPVVPIRTIWALDAAIKAADAARAPEIIAAVERFEEAVAASVARPSAEHRTTRGATKLALLALLGIEDAE